MKKSNKMSLTLLNVNALNADFKVPRLTVQKFINKKEVNPISSQPKNIIIALSAHTNSTMLSINQFNNNINLSALGSFLKYVNE
jgi:hypothetical protein